jgi:type II secretory pathway pseudopilin PulG
MKMRKVLEGERRKAFTLPEVLVGAFVLGFMSISLFAAFSTGLRIVQAGRENARATQIMLQKMEAIRLLTWDQTTNTTLAPTNFTDWYDPTRTNSGSGGTMYQGYYSISNSPSSIPNEYSGQMRLATVTVYWTNYFNTNAPLVHSRQMQTYVAHYGMQNYVNQ